MTDRTVLQERVEATGTWNLNQLPISFFALAVYTSAKGKTVVMPPAFAGERITGQFQGTALPQ